MEKIDVKIVKLEPMRVASAYAYGASPENDAQKKLIAWAKPRGLLNTTGQHRIFGFNNPDPSPGSPNYGYEFWITIGADVEPAGDIGIKEFNGGLYAITRCRIRNGAFDIIGVTWKKLAVWREGNSNYRCATHQWLEEHIGPFEVSKDFTLDLYLPIAE